MQVIFDIEANGLRPTEIYCAVLKDIATKEIYRFEHISQNPEPFLDFASRVHTWIGHNILGFDLPGLRNVLAKDAHRMGLKYSDDWFANSHAVDTLVVARFLNASLVGGHSLEAWGERFGIKKAHTGISDWSVYDPSMLERCMSDVEINERLYEYQLPYLQRDTLRRGIDVEHRTAILCRELSDNGFFFDMEGAETLRSELSARLKEIDDSLVSSFPSTVRVIKEFTPALTKAGTLTQKDFFWIPKERRHDLSFFKGGETYSLVTIEPFNPGSLTQIIDRMWDAGWKPKEKTKGHIEYLKSRDKDKEKGERYAKYGWKVSPENLLTLPDTAPEAAKRLVERILIASRVSDLEEWIALAVKGPDGYRIHGDYIGIGAWTHRMAHSKPNTANIPKEKFPVLTELDKLSNEINNKMRSFWTVPKGHRLIGTDADGIQMRVFAHYVNDERLISSLVSGSKKDGTDIHNLNRRALGEPCKSRDDAKTFIYAWLLGAGVSKVAEILGCSLEEARRAGSDFLEFYPGLKELKEKTIPQDAHRGFFYGLDKRPVICDNAHLVLAGYLQNGESTIMKYASQIWHATLRAEKIPFKFVNFVHDEWQTEVPDDDDIAKFVGKAQVSAIIQAGKDLELRCPLDGETKIGYNWQETH